ncbi:hypothetical protein GWC95_07310 [Sediminibacterium roseum]|uniref:YD repeat-containing protein n=1 Tax=Sediminibacterium roseum TaxID=1978412 RepID=A0ABW9ZRJ1_9BACT|nr:hypothetical protein [Sediminibacterium roseum]NCI49724.1 hypothetical protein [Sediminibacterium roseum]
MKRTCLVCFLAMLFSMVSCRKSEMAPAEGEDTVFFAGKKLRRITISGVLSEEFTYYSNGLLFKHTSYMTPTVRSSEQVFYYDTDGRMVRTVSLMNISNSWNTEAMDSGYVDYEYQNGLVSAAKYFVKTNGTPRQTSYTLFDFDAAKRIVAATVFLPAGQPASKNTYQYDGNGNVSVNEFFSYANGAPVLSMRYNFEYDNGKVPPQFAFLPPFTTNRNNLTREVYTNFNNVPGNPPVTTTTITYQYTAEGYPWKVKSSDGVERTYEYN